MSTRAFLRVVRPGDRYIPTAPASRTEVGRRRTIWDFHPSSQDRTVGYRALWMKVIIRAAFDWVSYRDSMKLELRKEAERACHWIFDDSTLFNSFENVCALIDLPAEKVRRWVRTLTKEHVAKIEHLERESPSPLALANAELRLIEGLDEDF